MPLSNTGILSGGGCASEQHSPNYFGITVENPSHLPTSNPGPYTQKSWDTLPSAQSSLPSPKLHSFPPNPASGDLLNLLKTESKTGHGRRESAFQSHSANIDVRPTTSPSSLQGLFNGRGPKGGNISELSSHDAIFSNSWGQPPLLTSPCFRDKIDAESHPRVGSKSASHPSRSTSCSTSREAWISAKPCADLLESSLQTILLLDVRPYAHYAQANIKGSLSLCIPTTLLKRRSFDTQKLEGTFTNDADKRQFGRWRECSAIIVYDSATANTKDASPLLNVLNKFQAEGWDGDGLILRDGFRGFSDRFPHLVHRPQSTGAGPSSQKHAPMSISLQSVAPVVGGCALPESSSTVNPFFGNIRQNMDLVGGVGQIPLRLPDHVTEAKRNSLPSWLQAASDARDQGRTVSAKFLDLEKKELARMKQALAYDGSSTSAGGTSKYRIAGIEKGTKNRYNDIYPFDYSRVRLEGVPSGACDYVNANHIKAEYSNRRYIATQAPVPDTINVSYLVPHSALVTPLTSLQDFWRVVWEQDIRLLVSLTAEVERGQVKCHPYWNSGEYGPFKVKAYTQQYINVESQFRPADPSVDSSTTMDERVHESNESPVIIVRHFSLLHTTFPFQPIRKVTQLQYPSWPDFGTTSQPTHLLHLIEQCNKVIRATSNSNFSRQQPEPSGHRPILVHCSAGCGRTGTFCTVDSVLDMLKRQLAKGTGHAAADTPHSQSGWTRDQSIDLIAKTVADFRTQRPSMVQNLSQFVLCYESVLEWLVSQMDEDN